MNRECGRVLLIVALITMSGLMLRLWHLEFGLPSRYHPDENAKVEVGTKILKGEPVTYFLHPGFLVNSVAASMKVSQWLGFEKSTYKLMWARLSVVFFATLSIPLIALLGWRIAGEWGSYFCAIMLAAVPIHVLHSRYTKEDIHLAFSVLLTLVMLEAWRRGSRRIGSWSFLGVAIGAGLSVSSKFVGVLMIPFAIGVVGASLGVARARLAAAIFITLGATILFLLFAHQVLSDPVQMWRGFQFELSHGATAVDKPKLNFWQWPDLGFFYLFTTIIPGLGFILPLVGCVGLGLSIKHVRTNVDEFALGLCAILWYSVAELTPLKRGTGVERYALPAAVLMIPLAAIAIREISRRWQIVPRRAFCISTVALVLLPLFQSVCVSDQIDSDTRREAQKWLNANAPRGDLRIGYLSQLYMPDWARRGKLVLCDVSKSEVDFRKSLESVNCFSMSSFYNDRYENFPHLSPSTVERIKLVREEFPRAIVFKRSYFRTMYFHQPVIEIRFRDGDAPTATSAP